MVQYICKKCDKHFDRKFLYDQHKNRKTDCSNKYNSGSKSSKKIDYVCKKCKRNFSRKDLLTRHSKNCKSNTNKNKGNNNANLNGKKNINGEKNINGNENIFNKNSKNSKITVNKDNNVNVILLNYPPDKYSFASDIGSILKSDKNLIMEIIKKTNINKDRPEHHNIYYPDHKKSVGEIYKNNRWNFKKIDEIINTMIENNTDCLKTYLNDLGLSLDKDINHKITKACQEFYNVDARKKLASYIKMLLFDNRKMIKKTKSKVKND